MLRRPVTLGALVAGGILLLAPSWAVSQCAFNAPGHATGTMKGFMVRYYAACPGITFLSPNTGTSTGGGTPGCALPVATSKFLFGPKGSCKLIVKSRIETPCSDGFGNSCANPAIKVACKDVRESDGHTAIHGEASSDSGTGWGLRAVARVTLDDPVIGDATVVDFPARFAIPAAHGGGKLKLKTSAQSFLEGFFPDSMALLAPCSSLELKSVSVVDPDGRIFAVLGTSTR
jgi:hypothetical protein